MTTKILAVLALALLISACEPTTPEGQPTPSPTAQPAATQASPPSADDHPAVNIAFKAGDKVKRGQKLFTVEAMKMETTVSSDVEGKVADVLVKPGSRVEAGDLLLRVE